jgi:hypothetical protein
MESGKAYPYGSAHSAGPGSSMQVILSPANECTLSGEGRIVTSEDKQAPMHKLITLERGKLDIMMEPEFTEFGSLDVAGTCLRASITKGGKLSAEAFVEGELQVIVVSCADATAQITGPQFKIALLDKDDVLMAACAPDLSFMRLKAAKGTFEVTIRDAEGGERIVSLETGSVIKLLQQRSGVKGMMVVTALIIGSDESVQEAITYSVSMESPAPAAAEPAAEPEAEPAAEPVAEPAVEPTAEPAKEGQAQTPEEKKSDVKEEVAADEGPDMEPPAQKSTLEPRGAGSVLDVEIQEFERDFPGDPTKPAPHPTPVGIH